MRSTFTRFSIITLIAAVFGQITHADGKPDGKKSLGGSGEMIQLELPSKDQMLEGIEVHGSRYGTATPPNEKFLIFILNSDRTEIVATKMAPYSLFERGDEKWVAIKFDKPVVCPAEGWIAIDFRAGRTKGVYVSYDADTSGDRSLVGLPGLESKKPDFEGDWMIRAILSR
jgi:hypothetical protein